VATRQRVALSHQDELVARGGRAAMLAAEAKLLMALRVAAERARAKLQHATRGRRERVRMLIAVKKTARDLETMLVEAVVAGRAGARHAAHERVQAELRRIQQELDAAEVPVAEVPAPGPKAAALDESASLSAASSFVAAWRSAMTLAVVSWTDGDAALDLGAVAERQEHRLDRIAVTETARAYQDEHDDETDWVATEHGKREWFAWVLKFWDATLDGKVCSTCRGMHGSVVPMGLRFDGGLEPAEVHPNCRCQEVLVPVPIPLGREGGHDVVVSDDEA
jgi:hypothetical protein